MKENEQEKPNSKYGKALEAIWNFTQTGSSVETFKHTKIFNEMMQLDGKEQAEKNLIVAYVVFRNWPSILMKKMQEKGLFKEVS